ncbi:MAG TPA: amidohydrolase family protein, partial [Longimicrobiales bacterium]|nr:amidohydrolase family protein [Longimicrobiales bacterium]
LQRPGRVLPFFGLHPGRSDHFDLMKEAVEERGFLGVKLYPSLGYEVDDPALLKVYEYCLEKDVPVLLHCGHGGFYRRQEFIDYCNPDHWIPVLQGDLSELRVCFAHFGGWQSLGRPDGLDPGTWGCTILDLMRDKPNVFTDLAYHTDQMRDAADEQHYFTKLAELLRDARLQKRILFGTDSWLLRLDMADVVYWRYFQHHMTAGDFDTIAGRAPRLFVGFPEAAGQPLRANLQRYVDYMTAHREEVGAEPAAWLAEAVDLDFVASRSAAQWNYDTHAVRCTYQFAKDLMSNAQKAKGFKVNRALQLRDLSYWRPRDPNFDGICQHNARLLLAFCRQIADYARGYDEVGAMSVCTDVFRRGEKALVDLAAVLDSIFAFTRRMS